MINTRCQCTQESPERSTKPKRQKKGTLSCLMVMSNLCVAYVIFLLYFQFHADKYTYCVIFIVPYLLGMMRKLINFRLKVLQVFLKKTGMSRLNGYILVRYLQIVELVIDF